MKYTVEEVYRTEGVPQFTFVRPPNYNEILVDMRTPGKPVIVEGQSGTGKTTTVRKIIELSLPEVNFEYLSARKSQDVTRIASVANGELFGSFIIDDFHRLDDKVQTKIADLVKIAAEEGDVGKFPKVVIIGINKVGSELIHLVHDVAKRCAIHRIQPADREKTLTLINAGEEKLNVKILNPEFVYEESKGDYWLTQAICQAICVMNDITQTAATPTDLKYDSDDVRSKMASRLEHSYYEAVKEFSRGRRFRSTNDPYFKLLKAISEQESSIVDITMLANQNSEVRGSVNNIKEERLNTLLESKPICERYFYYNSETKNFAIEDPAMFYYLKHLDWDALRRDCGFRVGEQEYEYDFALSFAGENRELARTIAAQLGMCDCAVFFDEYFENNFLGRTWSKQFEEIFGRKARFVIPILDGYYRDKIWPTFERECFAPRVQAGAVIPIYLDGTVFTGIPKDVVGIKFDGSQTTDQSNRVCDEIVFKLMDRLETEE